MPLEVQEFAFETRRLLKALENLPSFKDEHTFRVGIDSAEIARKIGRPRDEVVRTLLGGIIHDVKKIDERIWHLVDSEDSLTNQERALVREIHSNEGGKFVLSALAGHYDKVVLWHIAAIPFLHHHPYSGRYVDEDCRFALYPQKPDLFFLAGKDIPLGARIVAIADYFDGYVVDIRKHRREPHTKHEGIRRLIRLAGVEFDPQLVEVFLEHKLNYRPTWRSTDFWRLKKALVISRFRQFIRRLLSR